MPLLGLEPGPGGEMIGSNQEMLQYYGSVQKYLCIIGGGGAGHLVKAFLFILFILFVGYC